MGGSVKKIFMVLITVVACVLVGAFLLNILLPNATTTLIDSAEDMIYKATGMSFDFNSNGIAGSNKSSYQGTTSGSDGTGQGVVDGFN